MESIAKWPCGLLLVRVDVLLFILWPGGFGLLDGRVARYLRVSNGPIATAGFRFTTDASTLIWSLLPLAGFVADKPGSGRF